MFFVTCRKLPFFCSLILLWPRRQRQLFQSYLEGLFWVMRYYFRGPSQASWSWYYPYYHAPMALDLAGYDRVRAPQISLELGRPFLPFQQLMAVLPASSKARAACEVKR